MLNMKFKIHGCSGFCGRKDGRADGLTDGRKTGRLYRTLLKQVRQKQTLPSYAEERHYNTTKLVSRRTCPKTVSCCKIEKEN